MDVAIEQAREGDDVAQELLDKIVRDLESYKPLRVKLYEFTERYKGGVIDAPGTRGLVLVSAVACVAAVAAIPAGAGSAAVVGAFAIAGAAQGSIAANYIVNRIANPILKFFASKGFDPKVEIAKVHDLLEKSVNQNKEITDGEKQKVFNGVSSYIENMSTNLLTTEYSTGVRLPSSDSNENKLSWISRTLGMGLSNFKKSAPTISDSVSGSDLNNPVASVIDASPAQNASDSKPLPEAVPLAVDDMAKRIAELEAALKRSDDEKEQLQEQLDELNEERPGLKM